MAQTYSDKPTLAAWNALAGAGNCKIVYGTYVGDGAYGSSGARRIDFDAKPIIFIVRPEPIIISGAKLFGMRGIAWDSPWGESAKRVTFSWYDKAVRWYATSDATSMFNTSNGNYVYIALLDTSEE